MKLGKLISLCIALCFINGVAGADSKLILVTAKAVKSELILDNSQKNLDDSFTLAPATFLITFNDISVKQGVISEYEKELRFSINTRDDYPIVNAEKVYLLLDISNKEPRLLNWGIVASLVCLPVELIDQNYKDHYFELSEKKTQKNEKCSYIHPYYEASSVEL